MAGPNPIPIILAAVFIPTAIAMVGMRIHARRVLARHGGTRKLGMDDWMILPALLFAVAQGVILIVNACVGDLGQHGPLDATGQVIPSAKLETFQQLEYISFLMFVLALLFAKLSVLHLYHRIFGNRHTHPRTRIAIQATYLLNVIWGISFFFGFTFKCWPITDYWMTANETGHCLKNVFNYAFAVSNVVLDLTILLIPIPGLYMLQMPRRQKLALCGIFVLGVIVVLLSIVKAVAFFLTLQRVAYDHDITYDEAPLFYYAVPEALVAVISACLPALKPLFRKMATPIEVQMVSARRDTHATVVSIVAKDRTHVELYDTGISPRDLHVSDDEDLEAMAEYRHWMPRSSIPQVVLADERRS